MVVSYRGNFSLSFFPHPCMACSLWFNLHVFGMLAFLLSQPFLNTPVHINETCATLYLIHTLYVAIAIFRLILLLNINAEHTLHSRVKDSITHNYVIILI